MNVATIPCDMCGEPTPMLGTKLCNGCWELKTQTDSLITRNREAARTFFIETARRLHAPEGCEGKGRCHGPMSWCDACGDVSQVCDAIEGQCDCHIRCEHCGRLHSRDYECEETRAAWKAEDDAERIRQEQEEEQEAPKPGGMKCSHPMADRDLAAARCLRCGRGIEEDMGSS